MCMCTCTIYFYLQNLPGDIYLLLLLLLPKEEQEKFRSIVHVSLYSLLGEVDGGREGGGAGGGEAKVGSRVSPWNKVEC